MAKANFWTIMILAIGVGGIFPLHPQGLTLAHSQTMTPVLSTSWESGQPAGLTNKVEYSRSVVGYNNSSNPPPECVPRFHEITRTGSYSLKVAGYSRSRYAYVYFRLFDQDIEVSAGMKLSYWIYHEVGSPKIAIDGHFTDRSTLRDFGGGILKDQYGVRLHPGHRKDPMGQWYYVEVDLTPAAGKTLDFLMVAFDNGNDGFRGKFRTYIDDLAIMKPVASTEIKLFETGWENGQTRGIADRILYSKGVAGYFNSENPRPECSRRYRDILRTGDYALLLSGYSRESYSFCYFKAFNVEIPVRKGLRIGYWIYHAEGTPKISVDAHFTDETVLRDLNIGGPVTDQHGVPIHPARRKGPMGKWHYVEVDLSKAEGKTIDYIMFAYDNGGDGFTGPYRAWVDDFKIFYPEIQSLTAGEPKGPFGAGRQTDEVTEPETWRYSEYFYGHQGIDRIAWENDDCGVPHNYAIGWHQNDLIEYLMKFGGEYSRLTLRGKASRPGPVKMEIYIDGYYKATAAWDANNGCNQDTSVDILGIPFGTHAIAVKFVNDGSGPGWDRNFFLDGLLVTRPRAAHSIAWAYPIGSAESAEGWVMTNALGEDATEYRLYGHLGEDWAKYGGSLNQPVYAAAAGRVVIVRPNCGSFLDLVVIEHNVEGFMEPLYSFYGHIEAENYVREGDWVGRRAQIGIIGQPERYSPHLHFQIMNRTALFEGPLHYTCSDPSKGWFISAGYSGISNDYRNQGLTDYYDTSGRPASDRFYHPRRFIDERKYN